jgi:hypothetical protein
MKTGDMYIKKNNNESFVQQGEAFTKCFLDRQDHDMIDAGMGEYAGVYASAVKLLSIKTGSIHTIKLSELHWNFTKINIAS